MGAAVLDVDGRRVGGCEAMRELCREMAKVWTRGVAGSCRYLSTQDAPDVVLACDTSNIVMIVNIHH